MQGQMNLVGKGEKFYQVPVFSFLACNCCNCVVMVVNNIFPLNSPNIYGHVSTACRINRISLVEIYPCQSHCLCVEHCNPFIHHMIHLTNGTYLWLKLIYILFIVCFVFRSVIRGVNYSYTIEVNIGNKVSGPSPALHYQHGQPFCGNGRVET